MEIAAVLLLLGAFALGIARFICAITLMTDYRIDEYLATPRARRLWTVNMAAPPLMVAMVTVASYATHLWWVELPAWFLLAAVLSKTVWAIRMRMSGKYREFYKAAQWQ